MTIDRVMNKLKKLSEATGHNIKLTFDVDASSGLCRIDGTAKIGDIVTHKVLGMEILMSKLFSEYPYRATTTAFHACETIDKLEREIRGID